MIKCISNIKALAIAFSFLIGAGAALSQQQNGSSVLKTEHFDHDPGWEAFNNRVQPKKVPTVTQDFGYRQAEGANSENAIGGRVTRSAKPAFYADKTGVK